MATAVKLYIPATNLLLLHLYSIKFIKFIFIKMQYTSKRW